MDMFDGWAPARRPRITSPTGRTDIEVSRVQRHRNGISGVGFYTVEFTWADDTGTHACVGWVHDADEDGELEEECYGVLNLANPSLTYRGDFFLPMLQEAVRRYRRALDRALAEQRRERAHTRTPSRRPRTRVQGRRSS